FRRKARPKLVRDGLGEVLFQCNEIRHPPAVPFAPQLRAVRQIDEVCVNEQRIAALLHLTCKHRINTQLGPQLLQVGILPFVTKGSVAGDHLQLWYLRQVIDETFSNTVGQVLGVWVCGGVEEGQDYQRFDRGALIVRIAPTDIQVRPSDCGGEDGRNRYPDEHSAAAVRARLGSGRGASSSSFSRRGQPLKHIARARRPIGGGCSRQV